MPKSLDLVTTDAKGSAHQRMNLMVIVFVLEIDFDSFGLSRESISLHDAGLFQIRFVASTW